MLEALQAGPFVGLGQHCFVKPGAVSVYENVRLMSGPICCPVLAAHQTYHHGSQIASLVMLAVIAVRINCLTIYRLLQLTRLLALTVANKLQLGPVGKGFNSFLRWINFLVAVTTNIHDGVSTSSS